MILDCIHSYKEYKLQARNSHSKIMISAPSHPIIILLHLCIILTAYDSTSAYVPVENIALDCGSQANFTTADGRFWVRDTNSELISLVQLNNISEVSRAPRQPGSGGQVPYLTARLSYSPFTYSFTVSAGQKFIRLHFYPSSYPHFENSIAFFSVKAGRFTLLNNFTATADDGMDIARKEFCLDVEEDGKLNISFVPSSAIPEAIAFVNGIEVVSMPTNLYYTAPDSKDTTFIGMGSMFSVTNNLALETMYRVNVGGTTISNDTGMYRIWYEDDEFLTVAGTSWSISDLSIHLNFTKIKDYAAPPEIYKSARSMGNNGTINENYYLTWAFLVDSGFTYLVRLHFCEIQAVMNSTSAREFQILIAGQIAESQADVFYWSGGIGNPIYKDYVIMMGNTEDRKKRQNLTIQLHPGDRYRTLYSDAILNGVEIFKTSLNDNLAGINPEIPLRQPMPPLAGRLSTTHKPRVLFIIIGVVSGFVVLSISFFFLTRRRQKDNPTNPQGATLPSHLCRRFSLAEIKKATNNFDRVFIIGVGGFGNVYKGLIDDQATTVAIKRLNQGSKQGLNEFKTEIEMLSQLRYLHLVSLIGYCYEDTEMILVYDYMARGTLSGHLYNTDNPPLPWVRRLEICIGAARGLQYLHSGAKNTIIHRDVKATNILLDEKWVAKVSDFGLSKIGPTSMAKPHVSTVVKGSFGYLDPEYYRLQRLTDKSDVYSFGVVLCEVLSARPAVTRSAVNHPASLAEWARKCYRNGTIDDIVDPYLHGMIAPDCLRNFSDIAVSCLHDNGVDRPSMSDVVWGLEFALQLQEASMNQVGLEAETDMGMEKPLRWSSDDAKFDEMFSSGSGLVIGSRLSGMTLTSSSSSNEQSFLSNNSERVISGPVFSQITNPQGR